MAREYKYKHIWQRKVTYGAQFDLKKGLFTAEIYLGNGEVYAAGQHEQLGFAIVIALEHFGVRALKESHPAFGSDGKGRNLMPYLRPIEPFAEDGLHVYGDVPLPKDYQVGIRENAVLSGYEKTVSPDEFSMLTGIPKEEVWRLTVSGNIEVLTIPGAGSRIPLEIVDEFRSYWLGKSRRVASLVSEEFLAALYDLACRDGLERPSPAH